jgi:HEPN domain-containing protein
MPPDLPDPTSPAEWLRRARSNLARAKAGRTAPDILYEDLCFDAQQAAEKAIKALLFDRSVPFPRTHSIVELLTLLHLHGVDVPGEIRRTAALTRYAVDTRYPGLAEPVTEQDYRESVEMAQHVLRWATSLILPGGDPG